VTVLSTSTAFDRKSSEVIVLKLEMADDSVSIQDVADIMDTVDGGAFRRRLYQRIVHQQQPGPHWESSGC
jgi:hypothetical protein